MTLLPRYLVGGHYQIIRKLGAGNFGETYLAEDTQARGRNSAVKRFNFFSNDPNTFAKAKELFEREANVLIQLTDPPRNNKIPRFYAFFEENNQFYLVQEFIEGRTLREELQQKTRLDEDEVADLLEDVLEVLKFIHGENIIHRDIKPENLMRRDRDGRMVVIDFGAVKEKVTQLASTATKIYTSGYAPLEQHLGNPHFNSDIYALGITAIEALTGLEPDQFKDSNTGTIIWSSQLQVSSGLIKILEKMVEDDYRKGRYQSADAVLYDLKSFRKTTIVAPGGQNVRQIPPSGGFTLTEWFANIPKLLVFIILAPVVVGIAAPVAFFVSKFLLNPPTPPSPPISPTPEKTALPKIKNNPSPIPAKPDKSTIKDRNKTIPPSTKATPEEKSVEEEPDLPKPNSIPEDSDTDIPIRFKRAKPRPTATSTPKEEQSTPSETQSDSAVESPITFKRAKPRPTATSTPKEKQSTPRETQSDSSVESPIRFKRAQPQETPTSP